MMDQTSEWKIEICDVCCKEEGEPMLEDLLKRLEILKMLKFAAANTLEEVALKSVRFFVLDIVMFAYCLCSIVGLCQCH